MDIDVLPNSKYVHMSLNVRSLEATVVFTSMLASVIIMKKPPLEIIEVIQQQKRKK